MTLSAGEIFIVIIALFACAFGGYWIGFDHGYEYQRWEEKEDK